MVKLGAKELRKIEQGALEREARDAQSNHRPQKDPNWVLVRSEQEKLLGERLLTFAQGVVTGGPSFGKTSGFPTPPVRGAAGAAGIPAVAPVAPATRENMRAATRRNFTDQFGIPPAPAPAVATQQVPEPTAAEVDSLIKEMIQRNKWNYRNSEQPLAIQYSREARNDSNVVVSVTTNPIIMSPISIKVYPGRLSTLAQIQDAVRQRLADVPEVAAVKNAFA